MIILHAVLQCLSTLAAAYAFYLGIARFRTLHMGRKAAFKWKRHVWVGSFALILMFVGGLLGMMPVYLYWNRFLTAGLHAAIGMAMMPLMLFGLVSGYFMNRDKKKRPTLALVHGINNLLVSMLAIWQIKTGLQVYALYVLAG
jgi:VIT1/CCC1 family predicted Fe2+/Mn2+ transporter